MPDEKRNRELEKQIKEYAVFLLSEFTTQIPAHSNYLISAILGWLASLIALTIALGLSSLVSFWLKIEVGLSIGTVLTIVPFGIIVLYLYGRLLFYSGQMTIVNEVLGICGQANEEYYLPLYADVISNLELTGLSQVVLVEMLYRIKYGKFHLMTDEDGNTKQLPEREMIKGKTGFALRFALRGILANEDMVNALNKLADFHRAKGNTLTPSK